MIRVNDLIKATNNSTDITVLAEYRIGHAVVQLAIETVGGFTLDELVNFDVIDIEINENRMLITASPEIKVGGITRCREPFNADDEDIII